MNDTIIGTLHFRWPWRPYQQRVLNTLQNHLNDSKLHIVAAPGSGKTCLGLEVFRRLNASCVILSPTRTIRDQWLQRLIDFLPEGSECPPPWSSLSLDQPAFLTSLTYQALHTRYRDKGNVDDSDDAEDSDLNQPPTGNELRTVTTTLRQLKVRTVILDEAHHLRKEWWAALTELVEALPNAHTISLTATPPYDVIGPEWRRYEQLCGPIDDQISIPELVRAETLCPHQDYVYAVKPDPETSSQTLRYDRTAEQVTAQLLQDNQLAAAVEAHPWLTDPTTDAERILDDVELLSAILIYLKARSSRLPSHLMRLLGCNPRDLPPFNREWCQVLVRYYLTESKWLLPDSSARPPRITPQTT